MQDFNPDVQKAINRVQSYDLTRRAIDLFRASGIDAVNIDLVYGLPHQTRSSVDETVRQVLALAPDHIAIFGYAHLPARIKHQRLIPDAALPGSVELYGQSSRLARILAAAGYVRIGLDHFARKQDPLAAGRINRNFQGDTTYAAGTLIGFGASAIGSLDQGYAQNAVPVADYGRLISEHGLATVRGVALSDEDRARRFAIERLMCELSLPEDELRKRFGSAAEPILADASALLESDPDHLLEQLPAGLRVTERGRPFVRSIAACFDAYLDHTRGLHSTAV